MCVVHSRKCVISTHTQIPSYLVTQQKLMHMLVHIQILTDTTHMHTHYIHLIHTYMSARNFSVYRERCGQHTSRGRTEFELTQHSFVLKVETVVLKVETVVFFFCLLQVLHIRTI